MDIAGRIEQALIAAMARSEIAGCPSKLAGAMRYAVFPKGARIRPRLCHSVAMACGEDDPATTDAAGAALELLHCASLVHDDLPCFDAADMRRGRPSVHKAFGEPLAVLAGDALIVLAFQILSAQMARSARDRMAALTLAIAQAVGVPFGIVAGQAWECEAEIDLVHYHRAKTGALFAAAAVAGAAAAGASAEPWRLLGERLGEAYQVADDIRDATADAEEIGKPVGRDLALGRPSAVQVHGLDGALHQLHLLVHGAIDSMPPCVHGTELRALILSEARRLVPAKLAQFAA